MHLNPKEKSLVPWCLPSSRMDSTPFVARGLFSSVKDMPKEKDAVREESNVSLQLSLSCDYMGKEGIYYKESSEVGEINYSNQDQWKENKMEMKSEAFPSVLNDEKLSDISLELSLSGNYTYVPGGKSPESSNQYQREEHNNVNNRQKPKAGGLSLELSLGSDETWTAKKRERMGDSSGTRKLSSCRNKRIKVKREERSIELRQGHDPWCIKKKLTGSDLGSMARLLLASELVESHVFPFWNDDQLAKIKDGLPVSVWDCDTMTDHEMVFKRWNKGANVLIKNWVKDFVKRRELKLGDEIGLYWDIFSSRFKFSVLNPVASH